MSGIEMQARNAVLEWITEATSRLCSGSTIVDLVAFTSDAIDWISRNSSSSLAVAVDTQVYDALIADNKFHDVIIEHDVLLLPCAAGHLGNAFLINISHALSKSEFIGIPNVECVDLAEMEKQRLIGEFERMSYGALPRTVKVQVLVRITFDCPFILNDDCVLPCFTVNFAEK